MQLELFYTPKTDIQLLADEQVSIKAAMKNLRMGLFKRQTEHSKKIAELEAKNQHFECQFAIVMNAMKNYYEEKQNSIQ